MVQSKFNLNVQFYSYNFFYFWIYMYMGDVSILSISACMAGSIFNSWQHTRKKSNYAVGRETVQPGPRQLEPPNLHSAFFEAMVSSIVARSDS